MTSDTKHTKVLSACSHGYLVSADTPCYPCRISDLEAQLVYGFYEDEYPVYTNLAEAHSELSSVVTVDELNGLVSTIKTLKAQLTAANGRNAELNTDIQTISDLANIIAEAGTDKMNRDSRRNAVFIKKLADKHYNKALAAGESMNKSDLIQLLKDSDCGSDEINVAYFRWKHADDETYYVKDASRSVDAALGEIPEGFKWNRMTDGTIHLYRNDGAFVGKGLHKLLTHAILLAVVEADLRPSPDYKPVSTD